MKKNIYILIALATALFSSCQENKELADAYGNIETGEILVSSQAAGILESFQLEEGEVLKASQLIGLVDTLPLHIQKLELAAQKEVLKAQTGQLYTQLEVLNTQLDNQLREQKRIEKLLKVDASTPKAKDDIDGMIEVTHNQIRNVKAQNPALYAQLKALNAKEMLLNDKISKSKVLNPKQGTVLTKFAEEKELVGLGKPLYKLADLQNVYARVYVTGSQLAEIKLGQEVNVFYDIANQQLGEQKGKISFIASEAEFTPKTIQTKEERVDLVYAVKVRIANEKGIFKIGMPIEIRF